MRDVLRIEVVALEFNIGVRRGEQRQSEPLAEAEFQIALRLQRSPWRAADRERGESKVARGRFPIKVGRVADVSDIAAAPFHVRTPRYWKYCLTLNRNGGLRKRGAFAVCV